MKTCIQICLLIVGLSVQAQGFVECISEYYSPTAGLSDGTIGFTFRANDDLTITELGVFAYLFDSVGPIEVALWDDASNIVGSVTVAASSTLYNACLYEPLETPVSLLPMQVYYLGAFFPSLTGINFAGGGFGGSYTFNPAVEFLGLATSTNVFLSRPEPVPEATDILPGVANFRSPGVPEPGVFSLMLVGVLAFLASRRGQGV